MLLTVAFIAASPGAAQAANNVPVSGETWSDANRFYVSTNYRTISTDQGGNVYIMVYRFPQYVTMPNGTKQDDQLKWRLIGNDGSIWDNDTDYLSVIERSYKLTTKPVGFQFRNSYARYRTCQIAGCDHTFDAEMDY